MTPNTESRMYAAAFLIAAVITVVVCSYCDGRTDEALLEVTEREQLTEQAYVERDLWHDKYESLASETDANTVIAAETKLEQEARQ